MNPNRNRSTLHTQSIEKRRKLGTITICQLLQSPQMSITTKTGDDGTTSLLFNKRVPKSHPRVVACGQVDELSSALGICRASINAPETRAQILKIQQQLIHFMSELATDNADQAKHHQKYGKDAICQQIIDQLTECIRQKEPKFPFKGWKCAGNTLPDAFFDQARTTCRRAERGVVALVESGFEVRSELIQYLNRLADLLWLWSREYS